MFGDVLSPQTSVREGAVDGDGGGKHRDVSTPPPLLLLLHSGTLQQVGAGAGECPAVGAGC